MAMQALVTLRRTHPGFRMGYTMSCTNSSAPQKGNRLARRANAECHKVEMRGLAIAVLILRPVSGSPTKS